MAHGPTRSKSATRREGRNDPYNGASYAEGPIGTGETPPPVSLFAAAAATGGIATGSDTGPPAAPEGRRV